MARDNAGVSSVLPINLDDLLHCRGVESRIFEAMARNGSPPPRFDFDTGRTWFRATLPVHPEESATA